MSSCAPVAWGANRCLPLPVAFCETRCFSPRLPLFLSLTYFLCLSSSMRLRARLLCSADSVLGNVKSDLAWENFGRWVEAQMMEERTDTQAQSVHPPDCITASVCALMFAVMYMYMCACIGLALSWVTYTCHQPCQCICIKSKNRGHAMLFYYLTNPCCVKEADAMYCLEAFTFKVILSDMFT